MTPLQLCQGSLSLFISLYLFTSLFVTLSLSLTVVAAKVRETQRGWGVGKEKERGGLNKSMSRQDVLLPRFVSGWRGWGKAGQVGGWGRWGMT